MKTSHFVCAPPWPLPLACQAQSGWVSLFDGKTMAGWDDPRQKVPPGDAWTIDDGCLKANRGPHITEDLFTKDVFRDFELAWEWKVAPGANSGVKYRIQDRVFLAPYPGHRFEDVVNFSVENRPAERPDHGQEYVVGFEYQMLDNTRNSDARVGTSHQAGALYDIVGPVEGCHPAGGRVQRVAPGGEGQSRRALVEWREGGGDRPGFAARGGTHRAPLGSGNAGDHRSDQTAAQGLPHFAAEPWRRYLVP